MQLCFSKLDLDLEKYLKTSEKFMRPEIALFKRVHLKLEVNLNGPKIFL